MAVESMRASIDLLGTSVGVGMLRESIDSRRGKVDMLDKPIDQAAQNDPDWIVWSQPERVAEQVDMLFTETLPRVPADWTKPSGELAGPMPEGLDRYDPDLKSGWLVDVFDYFFPDDDSLYEPENAEVLDQFVCYIGEYLVRECDGRWVNDPEARIFGNFGPTIRYSWDEEIDYPLNLLFEAVEASDFMRVSMRLRLRRVRYVDEHELHTKSTN